MDVKLCYYPSEDSNTNTEEPNKKGRTYKAHPLRALKNFFTSF